MKNKRQRKKYAKQHGTYVDYKETWNLDCVIAKFVIPRLKLYKKVTNGYPGRLNSVDQWYEIIDKMIYSFTYFIEDRDIDLSDPDWKDKEKSEYEKVKDGLKLFAEYYADLWW